jgi:hypothetical protein
MNASLKNSVLPDTNSTYCSIETCVIKNRRVYQQIRYALLLLVSGSITLKTIFRYFQNYIFKRYKCIKEYFEKPTILLFQQYPVAPLVLHLTQWRLANETESLMVVQYATKPRNPE